MFLQLIIIHLIKIAYLCLKTLVNKENQIVPIEDIYNKNKYSYYTTKERVFEDNSLKNRRKY